MGAGAGSGIHRLRGRLMAGVGLDIHTTRLFGDNYLSP
jgi:hypothetical protein